MKQIQIILLSFGIAFLILCRLESSTAASIKAKEPSSPEITDAWFIPKQRRGREKRSLIFPDNESEEYALHNEDYDNWASNKVRVLWYGKDPEAPVKMTTEKPVMPINTTTRKNWYPDLPIAWGRMLDTP